MDLGVWTINRGKFIILTTLLFRRDSEGAEWVMVFLLRYSKMSNPICRKSGTWSPSHKRKMFMLLCCWIKLVSKSLKRFFYKAWLLVPTLSFCLILYKTCPKYSVSFSKSYSEHAVFVFSFMGWETSVKEGRCPNFNHRRSNAPVRCCSICGEVVNEKIPTKACKEEEHANSRQTFLRRSGPQSFLSNWEGQKIEEE